jgi:Sulfotransferase domain
VATIDNEVAVDFIYIGGPRCGSTWLSAVLDDHPQIFIPPSKEVHFFNDRMPYSFEYKYPLGLNHYRSYFTGARADQIVGDISPFYFLDPNTAWRIHRHFPKAKLICFLRDPVAMLHSLYLLLRQRERRAATFAEEIEKNPGLIDLCRYDRLLQPFYDLFPFSQICIYLYEELFVDGTGTAREIYNFLGVDSSFDPPSARQRFNTATDARPNPLRRRRGMVVDALNRPLLRPLKHVLLRHGLKDVRRYGMTESTHMPLRDAPEPAARALLESVLEPELRRLERRLGRSLAVWPSAPVNALSEERHLACASTQARSR